MAVVRDDHQRKLLSSTNFSGVVKKAHRGNGRAWRHEEEEYLRHARSRAIPYKQIATHLHKTELACRLHFHQLNFAHRRQSSLAVDGARSEASPTPEVTLQSGHSHLGTPSITVSYSPSPRTPYSTSPASVSGKFHTSPAVSIGTDWCFPRMPQTSHSGANVSHGIGLIWPTGPSSSPKLAPPATSQAAPDLGRLLYDYADNSRAFSRTSHINFRNRLPNLKLPSGIALSQNSSSPSPQPDRPRLAPLAWPYSSSENYQPRGYTNSQDPSARDLHAPSPKRCTVSSLLNFEKDTGSQKWGMSGA